jgi:Bacterial transcriptional activator domain
VPGLEFRVLGAVEVWLVAAHPFRESLVAQLMLAQYRAGRPADALATYDVLRRRLREELGADPDRTLRDLHATILSAGIIGGDDPAVAGLGQMLGGLPFALELAAARLRTMSLPALAERIMVRLDLLGIEGGRGWRISAAGPVPCAGATACWTSRAGCCSPGSRSSPAPSAWPTPSTPAPTLDWR